MRLFTARTITTLAVLAVVLRSSPDLQAQSNADRAREREIEHALESTLVSFEFEGIPFGEALEILQTTTGVNLVLHPDSFAAGEEPAVHLKVRRLSARNVLDLLLDLAGLEASHSHGALVLAKRGTIAGIMSVRVYDVRDLLMAVKNFEGPNISLTDARQDGGPGIIFRDPEPEPEPAVDRDELVDLVKDVASEEEWDAGTAVTVKGGLLIVRQRERVHREIARLVEMLRRAG